MIKKEDWEANFPDMYDEHIDPTAFDAENADQYIRKVTRADGCMLPRAKKIKLSVMV